MVGVNPIPTVITFEAVVTFWIKRYFLFALVTADVAKAVFAVVTEPNLVVREPLDELAVTVPLIAGSDPMVTELPTVTEEMLTGTVPLMDAVTEPIWFVPAGRAVPIVTFPETVTALALNWLFVRASVLSFLPYKDAVIVERGVLFT